MRAALVLALAAACGDNIDTSVHLDSGFADKNHSRFFAVVHGLGPAPARMIVPVAGASICIGDACTTSSSDGTFVLVGTGPGVEATLAVSAPGYLTTIMPVVGGAAGDRNLNEVLLVAPALNDQTAAAFHVDPMLDTHGAVLLEAARNDAGKVQVGIDGLTTLYLDDQQLPDLTRTQLATGAVFYGVAPGPAVVHTSAGRCDAATSGWPGDAPGDIRLSVVAGQLTVLDPICVGI